VVVALEKVAVLEEVWVVAMEVELAKVEVLVVEEALGKAVVLEVESVKVEV
jgi:hypothetical protein